MKKVKSLLIVLIIVLAVGIGGSIFFLDSIVNKFRPEIQSTLSSTLKTDVTFGELSTSVFPSVAIKLADVSLQQANAGAKGVSIENLYLKTSLLDLISGSISVSELKVVNASATIVRESKSTINVGGIKIGEKASAPQPTSPTPQKTNGDAYPSLPEATTTESPSPKLDKAESKPADSSGSVDMKIKRADIDGFTITFIDKAVSPQQTISIDDFEATFKDIDARGSAKVDLSASLLGLSKGNIRVNGQLGNPMENFPLDVKIEFADLNLERIKELAEAYGTKLDKVSLSNGLTLAAVFKSVPGGVETTLLVDGENSGISIAELFSKSSGDKLALDVNAVATLLGSVNAKSIKLSIGANELLASASAAMLQGPSAATLSTSNFSLAELGKFFPAAKPLNLTGSLNMNVDTKFDANSTPSPKGTLSLIDVGATHSVAENQSLEVSKVNGDIKFEPTKIKTDNLALLVAKQELSLKAVYSLPNQQAAFNISSDKLALWPILKNVKPDLTNLETSFLADLNLQGTHNTKSNAGSITLTTGNSSLAKTPMGKTSIKAKYSKTSANLEPSSISLFGGTINASARSTFTGEQAFSAKLSATNIDTGAATKAFLANSPIGLEGVIDNLQTILKGSGKNPAETVSGPATMLVKEGAITGFNLLGDTLAAITAIPGVTTATFSGAVPEEQSSVLESNSTQFDSMTADITLGSGRANMNQIKLSHSLYIIDGRGHFELSSGNMKVDAKMRLTPAITEKLVLRQPKLKLLLDRSGNLVVPLTIKKSGDSVKVLPDTEDLAERAAKNVAKEAAGRALDKLAPGAAGVLDSLF